jgi:hypothetical protein
MPLAGGTRLGPYEVLSAIGAGGMSACGHAERRPATPERGISEATRWGWPAFAKASARPPKLAEAEASGGGGPSATGELWGLSPSRSSRWR